MDSSDVFLDESLFLDGVTDNSESAAQLSEPGFGQSSAWITGQVPKMIPVCVEGDTSVVYGWLRTDQFSFRYTLRIYLICEEVEELTDEEQEP